MPERSPLAPERMPDLPPIAGVRLAAMAGGIRYRGRDDLLLVEVPPGTAVAGCLTRSLTAAAPVDWCRRALRGGRGRAFVVNAGNANAFTGRAGVATVEATAARAAELFGCGPDEVFLASTGVIGEPIPPDTIPSLLDGLRDSLAPDAWARAAGAITTTDTFPKAATAIAEIGGVRVTINGIAKGSGMIAPDMATMLAFMFTDAAVAPATLQTMLSEAVDRTFNCITVDSDTSTSDTVLLAATGAAGNAEVTDAAAPESAAFRVALERVCHDLALQVVRDGEGASKLVEIRIAGAEDDGAARRVGLAIGNSPLVKTAIAGEDANWGRIVMAVGKAGERAERDRLRIAIGGVTIATEGQVAEGYDETPVVEHMKGREILVEVDLGVGPGRAIVWTCDLTHGYIDINGSYRS